MRLKYFLTFLYCIFLANCTHCIKLNLDYSEKEWIVNFHANDKFYFKNKAGEIDTLKVGEIRNFHRDCNAIEVSKFQNEIYDIEFTLKSGKEYNNISCLLLLNKSSKDEIFPHIYFGNLGPLRNEIENKKIQPKPIDTILNGKKYTSIYYFKKEVNTEEYGDKAYFQNFFWSKHLGLIAYTTIKNEFYIKN